MLSIFFLDNLFMSECRAFRDFCEAQCWIERDEKSFLECVQKCCEDEIKKQNKRIYLKRLRQDHPKVYKDEYEIKKDY